MNLIFKNIAIIARQKNSGVEQTLIALCNYLPTLGVNLIFEQETVDLFALLQDFSHPVVAKENLGSCCDFLIVVGGDGSILSIAGSAALQNLPVLGVNRGRLGFLADIHPGEIEEISKILAGEYKEEQRNLLKMQIIVDEIAKCEEYILNDAVLSSAVATRLVEFSLDIDNNYVCNYHADGLIVATPTGSTAYALSAGGPILYPQLEAVVIVPMSSHNLNSRPIVINNTSVIKIQVGKNDSALFGISCDGRKTHPVPLGAEIQLSCAKNKLRLIHPRKYNYFDTLRDKLHWEKLN